jgi:HD-GYP domain-containing protein (c-di-GMP phosphodiesterase class II)
VVPRVDEDVVDLPGAAQRRDPDGQPAPGVAEAAEIGLDASHQRWDGGGYPDGLAGEEIPIASRIVAACDAFNAMTTDRSYRSAMSVAAAVRELRANSGAQFDPRVVEALVRAVGPVPAESTGKAA